MISFGKLSKITIFFAFLFGLVLFQIYQYADISLYNSGEICSINRNTVYNIITNTQKMFFIHSLGMLLFTELVNRLYMKPEVRIRYGKTFIYLLAIRGIVLSFLYPITVFSSLLISGVIIGTPLKFDFLYEPVKLYFFCLYCFAFYQAVYTVSKNTYLSVLLPFLANFIIMSIAISVNYFGADSNIYEFISSLPALIGVAVISQTISMSIIRKRDYL